MITMKKISVFTIILGLLVSLTASAATGTWNESRMAPIIYFDGGFSSTFFSARNTIPRQGTLTITMVSWSIHPYENGAPIQVYEVCYTPQYSSKIKKCLNVSSALNGSTTFFNGENARGSFLIRGTLSGGGSYPAFPPRNRKSSMTVSYQY